jgi:large subunit ribosomal protein L15
MAKRGRGSNTHGHGTHKRGAGRRGGRGKAGTKDARWMSTLKGKSRHGKYGHLGKRGFTRGRLTRDKSTVNLRWVDSHFDKEADLAAMGIDKLLGSGKITKKLNIKVATWTRKAEAKVEAAGGKISKD